MGKVYAKIQRNKKIKRKNRQKNSLQLKINLINSNKMGQGICLSLSGHTDLEPQLINEKHLKYKSAPYSYILQDMKRLMPAANCGEFLKQLSSYYNNVPYHNITHAFDVMLVTHLFNARQTCDKLLIDYKMSQELKVDPEERVYILLAAYAHDNGHQGLTNNYYINSQDQLAIMYSNESPLQRMHASNLLQALKAHNIPVPSKHKKLMVELILATDNKHHFQMIKKIQQYQQYLNQKVFQSLDDSKHNPSDPKNQIDHTKYKQILLEMIIHTADLSPCGKPLPQYLKWNQRLYDQFKTEYRKQRQMKLKQVTFHFDLKNQQLSMANQNLGFFNKMVLPFFKEVSLITPQFQYEFNNAVKIRNHFQEKAKTLQLKKGSQKIVEDKGTKQQKLNQKKQTKQIQPKHQLKRANF